MAIDGEDEVLVLAEQHVPQLFAVGHVVIGGFGHTVAVRIPLLLWAILLPVVTGVVVIDEGMRNENGGPVGMLGGDLIRPADDILAGTELQPQHQVVAPPSREEVITVFEPTRFFVVSAAKG